MTVLVDLCTGTASVPLWALGWVRPLTGFMGSKRQDADRLARILTGGRRPDEVLLVDAGPWGDAWVVLRTRRGRRDVARVIRETLAERVDALDAIDWGRVTVVHGDVRAVEPVPRSVVYFDPPYDRCPRYAVLLPRADVLDIAERHAEVADRVVVSEAEPLPLDGWRHERLRAGGKPEWLTMSAPPAAWCPPMHPRAVQQTLGL